MASIGEWESESESKSGSDSRSDLKASRRKSFPAGNSSSRSEDGKGAVQDVAVRAISQPSSRRAKKGKEKEPSPESQPKEGTGTVQPVHARAGSQPSSKRARKGGVAGKVTGPSVMRIGELFELSRVLWCWGNGGGMPTSPRNGRYAGALSKLPEEESEEKDRASISSLSQLMGLDEEVLRVGMRMIDSSIVEEIKERLRGHRMAVLQVGVDRGLLTNDLAKLFMDGYRAARK